jgi:hypothetical protein
MQKKKKKWSSEQPNERQDPIGTEYNRQQDDTSIQEGTYSAKADRQRWENQDPQTE